MVIRNATEKDFPKMMKIYAYARDFMKAHGNPKQWGPTNWPPEALIHNDIKDGNSYVCISDACAGHLSNAGIFALTHMVTISLCKILQKSLTLYTVERFMWKKMITQDWLKKNQKKL